MKTTVAQGFITNLDSASFRQLATQVLHRRGYKRVAETDGPNDGGTDIRVFVDGVSSSNVAVQVSVERDWKAKIRKDARKAKSRLGSTVFEYMSSRRIPEAEFQTISEELRSEGIIARKLDSQSLAGLILQYGLVDDLLQLSGVNAEDFRHVPPKRLSPHDEAALACTFFSDDSHDFRRGVVDSAIFYVLTDVYPAGLRRSELIEKCRHLVGQGFVDGARINSEVDSLLSRGMLESQGGEIACSSEGKSQVAATTAMRDALLLEALSRIKKLVRDCSGKMISDEDAKRILDLGGTLIRESQKWAISPFSNGEGRFLRATEQSRQRFHEFHRVLDEVGIADGAHRDELVYRIAQSIAESHLGQVLAAGELYINMASYTGSALRAALDGGSEIRILLDASVAMPLLIGLMFGDGAGPASALAVRFRDMCIEREVGISITDFYIGECAAHLIAADEKWGGIVDEIPDLAGSCNFFVAAYASLKESGRAETFADFLRKLGLASTMRHKDPEVARAQVCGKISSILSRYDIKIEKAVKIDRITRKKVGSVFDTFEEQGQLDWGRNHIVVENDERAVCILEERSATKRASWWFCTWHRLHFLAAKYLSSDWMPFTPIGIIELLGVLIPGDAEPPSSVLWLIRAAQDSTIYHAAQIWDTIAKIESSNLQNVDLLELAREFHAQYLAATQDEPSAVRIKEEWEKFKAAHSISE